MPPLKLPKAGQRAVVFDSRRDPQCRTRLTGIPGAGVTAVVKPPGHPGEGLVHTGAAGGRSAIG